MSPSSMHPEQSTTTDTACSTSPTSGISSWPRSLSFQHSIKPGQAESDTQNAAKSPVSRLAGGLGVSLERKNSGPNGSADSPSVTPQPSVFGNLTKGLVDSSLSAVKAVQLKARRIVSQNKRRYQVCYISPAAAMKPLILCHFIIPLKFILSC